MEGDGQWLALSEELELNKSMLFLILVTTVNFTGSDLRKFINECSPSKRKFQTGIVEQTTAGTDMFVFFNFDLKIEIF